MFYYFGYGSNLSLAALRAKGVDPISFEPAILRDWKLCFNIPNFFRSEGGTGNIAPFQGGEVHGVLYKCREKDLAILDRLEALGVAYERSTHVVTTYSGQALEAFTYVGIKAHFQEGLQPSRRYMNILIRGAKEMLLAPGYIHYLEASEVIPEQVPRNFRFPSSPSRVFTLAELHNTPYHTALAGAVFDMTQARSEHSYLQEFFQGKDMSLFFLKRMDSSDGGESMQDLLEGRLTTAQKRYLTNYLHEFDREYLFAGRMDYHIDLDIQPKMPVRLPLPRRQFTPSWAVLENAEKINASLGHENLGFLSSTHGFMPKEAPRSELPKPFAAWDEASRELPRLYRSLGVRKLFDELPILGASESELGDRYLLRAASVLGMLTHAYHYVETSPPEGLPPSLLTPWKEILRRLGRDQEVLSYIDLIVYNWKYRDASSPSGRIVENMDLMIPTVGTREECQFYLTQTEILAQCSPLVAAVVDCQEAVKHEDNERLGDGLITIAETLQQVLRFSLPKINPSPESLHHVDAVVWAKTVAPFAVPMQPGLQGPSGTSSPIFNLLDIFFGRRQYATFLGKEIKSLRSTYPLFWREFLQSVGEISINSFIEASKDKRLISLLRETIDVYAGENGFLGRHRMKVFGYIETAFKVGRSVTIGGFAGAFKDRTWDEVDTELEYSRKERMLSFPKVCHYAYVKSVGQTHDSGSEGVKHLVLDVSQTGVRYRPGDRCGILPENTDDLITITLEALEATGGEEIILTEEWAQATALRYGYEYATSLKLRDFLKFGRIRPVEPRVAEAFHAATQSPTLLKAIKRQRVEQWELWDLLLLLKQEGYDVTRLWKEAPSSPEYISRIVPPEGFRRYSIASAANDPTYADEIHLTVGKLTYNAVDYRTGAPTLRYGTASHFLASAAGRKEPISFILDRPAQFRLPEDPKVPIIMLAGGTGFAPFRGFISERLKHADAGLSWILLGLTSREYFYYNDNFVPGLANNSLRLDVIFSQEDTSVSFHRTSTNSGELQYGRGKRGYIQDHLRRDHIAREIWEMLKEPSEGGKGAHLYVCGRTRFAKACLEVLHEIFARFEEGTQAERMLKAQAVMHKITASGRFMQEVFTHSQVTDSAVRLFDISTIANHNSPANGYWLIIDSVVYDLTKFLGMHPGGDTPLLNYAGTDATQGFMRAHKERADIDAMRKMYEIGLVRHLDFKGVTRQTKNASGEETTVALATLYRAWVSSLYLLVEMENTLRLDHSFQVKKTTRGESAPDETLYKLQRSIETHNRFIVNYIADLSTNVLPKMAQLTHSLCHTSADARATDPYVHTRPTEHSSYTFDFVARLHAALALVPRQGASQEAYALGSEKHEKHGKREEKLRRELASSLAEIDRSDSSFIKELKGALTSGLRLFEQHGERTIEKAGSRLLELTSRDFAAIFARYYAAQQEIALAYQPHLEAPRAYPLPQPSQAKEGHLLLVSRYWELEERMAEKALILRRSAVPVASLEDLIAKNEALIELMREFRGFGIVVDMRQAPPRNDPAFENAMIDLRANINSLFTRVAVLLESEAGVLQVNRIGRQEGAKTFATVSEPAALRFAKG